MVVTKKDLSFKEKTIHESYEDYIKCIYLISKNKKGGWVSNSEISKFLKVKPSSVSSMLYKLKNNELIDWRPRKLLRLTAKGMHLAQKLIKNYNILRRFFVNILNTTNQDVIEDICCKIEHHLTTDVFEALELLLSNASH